MEAYVTRATLAVPAKYKGVVEAMASGQSHGKIEAYSGTKAIDQYGITVIGSGAWASGHLSGSIQTYSYEALYKVYNLKSSESADYWFVHYHKDTSHDELKLANEQTKTTENKYDLNFQIQGNDWGQSSVFITYQVIRLVVDGVTKDYVVTNNASAGANNADGSKYQGGFKAE